VVSEPAPLRQPNRDARFFRLARKLRKYLQQGWLGAEDVAHQTWRSEFFRWSACLPGNASWAKRRYRRPAKIHRTRHRDECGPVFSAVDLSCRSAELQRELPVRRRRASDQT